MSPSNIKLIFDENIPVKVIEIIEKKGFDAKKVPKGSKDKEIASLALKERRTIITFDRHFSNILLFPPQQYEGIIFIRINPPLIKTVAMALLNLFNSLNAEEFKGKLFVLLPFGYRIYKDNIKKK